ncbi:hypothetical protein FIBSPDRAFT_856872 [Athelia psychrophila]|uniref:DUF2423 domain-containing protein n=1 Tax=Athelia psychrophila TaxID=1759441 RepID=A0A166N5L4_9AGAM|nr:hypothetical protein FIBSPDRAFT_856872 [Fibularhizoctonia sp. CBS 109695]
MAKSMRSKVKRSHRTKKREDGVYAATEAARLDRLHSKLVAVKDARKEDAERGEDEMDVPDDEVAKGTNGLAEEMEVDGKSTKISTHGPRGSRNEQWRLSKGMTPRPQSKGNNRQGVPIAKRKASKPARRR